MTLGDRRSIASTRNEDGEPPNQATPGQRPPVRCRGRAPSSCDRSGARGRSFHPRGARGSRQMPESHQPSGRLELDDHILQHSQPAVPRLCRLEPLVPSSPGHWLLGAAKATSCREPKPDALRTRKSVTARPGVPIATHVPEVAELSSSRHLSRRACNFTHIFVLTAENLFAIETLFVAPTAPLFFPQADKRPVKLRLRVLAISAVRLWSDHTAPPGPPQARGQRSPETTPPCARVPPTTGSTGPLRRGSGRRCRWENA